MFNRHHYLYVENDPFSREIMQMTMGMGMGVYTLTVFENSQNFLPRLKALPWSIDVFLLDIQAQPDNGFVLLSLLRDDPLFRSARVVALTGTLTGDEIEHLRQSGFDGAIARPVSLETFPHLLSRIIIGEPVWQVA